MNIKVIGKRVLAKEIKPTKKEGILIVPDAKKTEQLAIVTATGTECADLIKIGDKILIRAVYIERVNPNDEELMLVPLSEIIGVIE